MPLCDFKSFIFQDNIERKDTNINKYDLNQRESPVPENLGKLTIKKFQQKLKNAHVWLITLNKVLKMTLFAMDLIEIMHKSWVNRRNQRIEVGEEENVVSGDDFNVLFKQMKKL